MRLYIFFGHCSFISFVHELKKVIPWSYDNSLSITWKWHEMLWEVSVYMYITFSNIGSSTTLNSPVYVYAMSLQLLVSSFLQECPMIFSVQMFHFLRRLFHCLAWVLYSQGWERWAHEESDISTLPSIPALWLLVAQEHWVTPFTSAYQGSPYRDFLWIWVFTLLQECPQGLSQCLIWVQEPQIPTNDHLRPPNLLQ